MQYIIRLSNPNIRENILQLNLLLNLRRGYNLEIREIKQN